MDVPATLRDRPNWVLWKYVGTERRKVPFQPNGQPAKSNDPTTWSTLPVAEAANTNGYAGLGYVFDGSGVFGVDLDGCIDAAGVVQPWAAEILAEFPTYQETSPSGTGIKVYGLGRLSTGGKKREIAVPPVCDRKPAVEAYDRGRYFCFTGRLFGNHAELADCQAALDALVARLWPPVQPTPQPARQTYSPANTHGGPLDAAERAKLYVAAIPPAVSGSGRGQVTFHVACVLVLGFGLSPEQALPILAGWNASCLPQTWPPDKIDKELRRTLANADKQSGDRGFLLDGRGYTGPDVDLRNLLAGMAGAAEVPAPEPPPAPADFPAECIDGMPRLMRLAYDWIIETSIKPQPMLTLGGLVAMFGAVFGRRVRDDYNTRSNVMVLGLAPSGAGKEAPRQRIKEILYRAGMDLINGPERIGSHAGIISSLVQHPSRLFQLDEIGKLLATMRDPKNAPHLWNIGAVLMQLYSSSNTIWIGDAYADTSKTKRINQPCVCVFGTSVPDGFYGNLTVQNLSDGLLGRMIVLESEGYGERRKPNICDPPAELVEAVSAWTNIPGGGNLSIENPTTLLVEKTSDASRRHERYCDEVHKRHTQDDEQAASMWARAPEKAAKLSLIYACCEAFGKPPVIDLKAINWGRLMANYTTRLVIERAQSRVTSSRYEDDKYRAWKKLKSGMTVNEFTRRTQWLRIRDRQEILADWTSSGAVEVVAEQTAGRPKTTLKKLRGMP